DVRYYGRWIRDRALGLIGHLYPPAILPNGMKADVVAWLWARSVVCKNPACGFEIPLARSFVLSTKRGRSAYVSPELDHITKSISFVVKQGESPQMGTMRERTAMCLACGSPHDLAYVRSEATA